MPAPAADSKELAKALEGRWRAVSSEQSGRQEPEEQAKRHVLVFRGDTFTIERDGQMMMRGKYKLDASKTPVAIDLTVEEHANHPDQAGRVALGIIEQSGDGLKWCTATPDSTERPTEFKTTDGSGRMLVTLKREKAE
jgi:uncharacterized protein (TIGR03067 family)